MRSCFQYAVSIALSVVACSLTGAVSLPPRQAPTPASCNAPLPDPITRIDIKGIANNVWHPVSTRDGCWIFVAIGGGAATSAAHGVQVLRRRGDTYEQVRFVSIDAARALPSVALTHDQKTLIVSVSGGRTSGRVEFFDVSRLISGQGDEVAAIGSVTDRRFAATFLVHVTSDDKHVFVSQRATSWISIIDLDKVRSGQLAAAIVGGVPVTGEPERSALSPDQHFLYVCTTNGPEIHVIDVDRALTRPESAVVASIPGGMTGAIAVSPDGNTLYAGPAGDDTLLLFDVQPLRTGGIPKLIAKRPMPAAIVQMALVDDGRKLIVHSLDRNSGNLTDSGRGARGAVEAGGQNVPPAIQDAIQNLPDEQRAAIQAVFQNPLGNRGGGRGQPQQVVQEVLTVLDTAKLAEGLDAALATASVGVGAGVLSVSPDGRTILRGASQTLVLVDWSRLSGNVIGANSAVDPVDPVPAISSAAAIPPADFLPPGEGTTGTWLITGVANAPWVLVMEQKGASVTGTIRQTMGSGARAAGGRDSLAAIAQVQPAILLEGIVKGKQIKLNISMPGGLSDLAAQVNGRATASDESTMKFEGNINGETISFSRTGGLVGAAALFGAGGARQFTATRQANPNAGAASLPARQSPTPASLMVAPVQAPASPGAVSATKNIFLADLAPDGRVRGPVKALMEDPRFSYHSPAWSPDGRTIAVKRRPSTAPSLEQARVVTGIDEIVLFSLSNNKEARIFPPPIQPLPNPWFHDGGALLGNGFGECPTGPYRCVARFDVKAEPGPGYRGWSSSQFTTTNFPLVVTLMALSPDDKTLYTVPRSPLPGDAKNNKLVTIDLSTGTEKKRQTLPVTENIRELALSPNGRTLAMWTGAPNPELLSGASTESRLFRVDIDGGGYREIYRGQGANLAWTPDGRSLLFAKPDNGEDWQIVRIQADGGEEQFTGLRVKGLTSLSLSPDGSRLAFDGASATIGVAASLPARQAQNPANCNQPLPDAITHVKIPQGSPVNTTASKDGCWLFAVLEPKALNGARGDPGGMKGLAVLRRNAGAVEVARFLPLADIAQTSGVITNDGKILIVSAQQSVVFLDIEKLISGKDDPILARVGDQRFSRAGGSAVTADGMHLFVLQSGTDWVTHVAMTSEGGEFHPTIEGGFPAGLQPLGFVLSADERFIFIASTVGEELNWPLVCNSGRGREGAIQVIDVQRARSNGASPVVATIKAGCSTRRIVVAPDGNTLYATAAEDNALLAFDARPLRSGGPPTLIGKVPVGSTPVGLAIADGGKKIVVSNSNYLGAAKNDTTTLTVIDAARIAEGRSAIIGTIPAGSDPRNISVTPDGRTLLVSNHGSGTLEIVDLTRVDFDPQKK